MFMLKTRLLGLVTLTVASALLFPAATRAQSLVLPGATDALVQPGATDFLVTGMAQSRASRSSRSEGGVGFGVKGGLLYSSYREAGQDFRNNDGWEAGIFFGGNRPGVVGVMGEVLYAKKGAKDPVTSDAVDAYYIEIPILLRVNLGSSNRNTGAVVYVIGGPVADVLLSAKLNGVTDIKDNYQGLDLGVIGGAGVEISRFLIEARLNWGLRNIVKGSTTVSDIKTKSFAVLAGFRFN
jgi:hypothetical protein